MFKIVLLLLVLSAFSADRSHGKRLQTFQSQHELGELCMPGTCVAINSNCKRVIGGSFRCVCKDQHLAINQTHCVRIIDPTVDDGCASCEEKQGICLDDDNDDHLDRCFCPSKNLLCNSNQTHQRPVTADKNHSVETKPNQKTNFQIKAKNFVDKDVIGDDDVMMNLYDIDQKQWLVNPKNQSTITIHHSDHLYIDIKYRQNAYSSQFFLHQRRHNQMVMEKCEIMFNVTQKQQQIMKRILLSQHGCPSSVDFRMVDQDHVRSSIFSIEHTDEQRLVIILQCSIRLCLNNGPECQQSACSLVQSKSMSSGDVTYEVRAAQQAFVLQRPVSSSHNISSGDRSSLSKETNVAYSVAIGAIAVIFLVLIALALFVIDQRCLVVRSSANSLIEMINGQDLSLEEKMRNQCEESSEYDLQDRWNEYRGHPNVVMTNVQPISNERKLY